jgi:hypothetical protein
MSGGNDEDVMREKMNVDKGKERADPIDDVNDTALNESAATGTPAPAPAPAPAPTGTSAPTQLQSQRTVPIEHGPLTIREACSVVSQHYGGTFSKIQYNFEPIVRENSIVTFQVPGGGFDLAQGMIRSLGQPVFDKEHNMFLPMAVYNLMFPRIPTPVSFGSS